MLTIFFINLKITLHVSIKIFNEINIMLILWEVQTYITTCYKTYHVRVAQIFLMWNVCEPFGLKWPLGALSLGEELQHRCLNGRDIGFGKKQIAKVYGLIHVQDMQKNQLYSVKSESIKMLLYFLICIVHCDIHHSNGLYNTFQNNMNLLVNCVLYNIVFVNCNKLYLNDRNLHSCPSGVKGSTHVPVSLLAAFSTVSVFGAIVCACCFCGCSGATLKFAAYFGML